MRSARSAASDLECSDEYSLGMETQTTRSGPSASTATAATTAESMPPDSATTTAPKPFFST